MEDVDSILYKIAYFYKGGVTIDWLERQEFSRVIKAYEEADKITKEINRDINKSRQ